MCPSGGAAAQFPDAIATSARFDVSYQLFEDGSDAQVSSAASSLIETNGTAFRALRSGVGALMARRTADGVTVDFTHLSILDIAEIEVRGDSGDPVSLVMDVGVLQNLVAQPLDETAAVLAGAAFFQWTVSDPAVLTLELASGTGRMSVRAASPGTATLEVGHGEISESFEIEVAP
jgi:hypothetical protein